MKKTIVLLAMAAFGLANATAPSVLLATTKEEVKHMEKHEKKREAREKKREKREKKKEKEQRLKIKEKKLEASK